MLVFDHYCLYSVAGVRHKVFGDKLSTSCIQQQINLRRLRRQSHVLHVPVTRPFYQASFAEAGESGLERGSL